MRLSYYLSGMSRLLFSCLSLKFRQGAQEVSSHLHVVIRIFECKIPACQCLAFVVTVVCHRYPWFCIKNTSVNVKQSHRGLPRITYQNRQKKLTNSSVFSKERYGSFVGKRPRRWCWRFLRHFRACHHRFVAIPCQMILKNLVSWVQSPKAVSPFLIIIATFGPSHTFEATELNITPFLPTCTHFD